MSKNKKPVQDEAQKIQEAILMREVEEQMQKERLTKLWHKYRFVLYGIVTLVFVTVTGSQIYYAWSQKMALNDSNKFETALLESKTGNRNTALSAYDDLFETAHTNYKYLAQLRIASMYLEFDKPKAVAVLKDVMNDTNAPKAIQNVARLAYVGHQIGNESPDILQQELAPLLAKKDAYYTSAVELQSVLLIIKNQPKDAVLLLESALQQPDISIEAQSRLNVILSVIKK